MISRIVSGGQTGADRATLDWAIRHDIPTAAAVLQATANTVLLSDPRQR